MGQQKNSAHITWKGEGLNFESQLGSGYQFEFGSGDDKIGGSPMEFLIAGMAGCAAVDVVLILQKQRQNISGVEVEVAGIRAETHPKVYTDVELIYIIRGKDVKPKAVEKAIRLSEEKYCSASALFRRGGVKLNSSYRIEQEA